MTITVEVQGTPKGQPRPRAFSRGGTAGVYDPGTAEGWKSEIALALRPWARLNEPGAVQVEMAFRFERPKSHRVPSGALRRTAPDEMVYRPDTDNLVKAVLDCCTAIGMWRDDSQVVSLVASKTWATWPIEWAGMSLAIRTVLESGKEAP